MLGIIATIIAAKKGHSTFAWVVGIWSAIEIIMLLAKSPYAVGPGGMFIVIALCMKNLNTPQKERKPSNDPPKGINKVFSTTPVETTVAGVETSTNRSTQENDNSSSSHLLRNTTYATRGSTNEPQYEGAAMRHTMEIPRTRFCRKCGFKLLTESDFCSHCGTKIVTIPQEPLVTESTSDSTIMESEAEEQPVRNQEFWEHLQQLCVAAQEQFKEETLPILNDAGLLSASGNTVRIDINDMKRPMLIIAELWVFPIAVLVAALNDYLPFITEEDEKNIQQYLYSCGDEVLQALQQIAKDEARILYGRLSDYNTACKNEMVCGFSSYGQGKILFHDFDELESCAEDRNHEAKCAMLFGDCLYYYNYYGSLPALADIHKLKNVVVKNAANYAIKFENLYRSVHPFVSAMFSEVKSITGG